MRFLPVESLGDRPAVARVLLAVAALTLIASFALAGPLALTGMAAIGLAALGGALLLPRPPLSALWPACGLLLLLPQIAPAVYVYDAVIGLAFVAAVLWTLSRSDVRVWNVGPAGLLAGATLAVPLLAVPAVVVSLPSFLAQYRFYLAFVVMFLALRRLVPRSESRMLLWIGPVVGTWASLQLLMKTAGVGAASLLKLSLRNFHTNLGWGQSNYIAAILVLCLGISALLLVLERRLWARLLILAACLLMMRSFVFLYSRTATVALVFFFLIVIGGRGGRAALMAGAAAVGIVLVFAATPFGAVLVSRFVDPTEFASTKVRFDVWRSAVERFLEHPWTGVGLNQGRYQLDIMSIDHAHNTFLDYISEQGVFGGILYLVLLGAVFRLAARVRVDDPVVHPRTLQVLCVAIVAAVFVNSMAEPTWNAYVYSLILVHFLAWMSIQRPDPTPPGGAANS